MSAACDAQAVLLPSIPQVIDQLSVKNSLTADQKADAIDKFDDLADLRDDMPDFDKVRIAFAALLLFLSLSLVLILMGYVQYSTLATARSRPTPCWTSE